jgi:hypothetical protein
MDYYAIKIYFEKKLQTWTMRKETSKKKEPAEPAETTEQILIVIHLL